MAILLWGQPGPADPGNPEVPDLCCYNKVYHLGAEQQIHSSARII